MLKKFFAGCLILLLFFQCGCGTEVPAVVGEKAYQEKGVTITDKGNYYDVVLDYSSGLTHRQMGEAFARGILRVIPDYEYLVDSYIAENLPKSEYPYSFFRVDDIKPQLNKDYVDEIEGMASVFSGGRNNVWNDKKVSIDEFYIFNLFTDIVRNTECSVVSVFKSRSETGKTITGRNLDWYGGSINQLPKIQAVITYKYPDKKVCSIGYMGYLGIITGFNDSKVFAAILDSQSGAAFNSVGKRSYPLDIRFALESKKTMYEAIDFMKDPQKNYTFNHVIALSDPDESVMLENNFSGVGTEDRRVKRDVRKSDSKLNKGVTWGIQDAIGSVNSFILKGNYDNHKPNKYNTKRWDNMKKQLLAKGSKVTPEEVKEIMSYDKGSPGTFSESGDLYNKMTLQMVVFQPDSLSLEVFFRPRDSRRNPDSPVFEKVDVFH
ncbi:MAG TPA: C45 family peptidase [Ruminiclostridium sp.]|nr:C45 family peptidase [Ruminiclostridium sp.]